MSMHVGSICRIKDELRKKLFQAKKDLECKQHCMKHAEDSEWQNYRIPWQNLQLKISKYESALIRLITCAIQSTIQLHKWGLLHLDIKGTYDQYNYVYMHMCIRIIIIFSE